jgi:hypothetical protein
MVRNTNIGSNETEMPVSWQQKLENGLRLLEQLDQLNALLARTEQRANQQVRQLEQLDMLRFLQTAVPTTVFAGVEQWLNEFYPAVESNDDYLLTENQSDRNLLVNTYRAYLARQQQQQAQANQGAPATGGFAGNNPQTRNVAPNQQNRMSQPTTRELFQQQLTPITQIFLETRRRLQEAQQRRDALERLAPWLRRSLMQRAAAQMDEASNRLDELLTLQDQRPLNHQEGHELNELQTLQMQPNLQHLPRLRERLETELQQLDQLLQDQTDPLQPEQFAAQRWEEMNQLDTWLQEPGQAQGFQQYQQIARTSPQALQRLSVMQRLEVQEQRLAGLNAAELEQWRHEQIRLIRYQEERRVRQRLENQIRRSLEDRLWREVEEKQNQEDRFDDLWEKALRNESNVTLARQLVDRTLLEEANQEVQNQMHNPAVRQQIQQEVDREMRSGAGARLVDEAVHRRVAGQRNLLQGWRDRLPLDTSREQWLQIDMQLLDEQQQRQNERLARLFAAMNSLTQLKHQFVQSLESISKVMPNLSPEETNEEFQRLERIRQDREKWSEEARQLSAGETSLATNREHLEDRLQHPELEPLAGQRRTDEQGPELAEQGRMLEELLEKLEKAVEKHQTIQEQLEKHHSLLQGSKTTEKELEENTKELKITKNVREAYSEAAKKRGEHIKALEQQKAALLNEKAELGKTIKKELNKTKSQIDALDERERPFKELGSLIDRLKEIESLKTDWKNDKEGFEQEKKLIEKLKVKRAKDNRQAVLKQLWKMKGADEPSQVESPAESSASAMLSGARPSDIRQRLRAVANVTATSARLPDGTMSQPAPQAFREQLQNGQYTLRVANDNGDHISGWLFRLERNGPLLVVERPDPRNPRQGPPTIAIVTADQIRRAGREDLLDAFENNPNHIARDGFNIPPLSRQKDAPTKGHNKSPSR